MMRSVQRMRAKRRNRFALYVNTLASRPSLSVGIFFEMIKVSGSLILEMMSELNLNRGEKESRRRSMN